MNKRVKMTFIFTADLDIKVGGKFFYIEDWERWVKLNLTTPPKAVVYNAEVEVKLLEVLIHD